jgi:hypothetical protein
MFAACGLSSLLILVGAVSAAPDACWELSTADTHVVVTVQEGQPAIAALGVPGAEHAWVDGPIPIPLMGMVAVDGEEMPTHP